MDDYQKIEKIGEKTKKFCDIELDSVTFEKKRLRVLAIEIFKTLNDLNPPYMKDFFKKSTNRTSQRLGNNFKCREKWFTHSYLYSQAWTWPPSTSI